MPLWLKTQVGHATYNYGIAQLSAVYSGIGQARKFSAALRSSNRYFLNLNDNTQHSQIFSAAKCEAKNGAPNFSDTVFCFVNLDRNANPQTVGANKFNVNIDTDANGVNDFGIKFARRYNVKNIAAYLGTDPARCNAFLIPGDILGSDLLAQGLFVALNRVPTTAAAWATAPYEAQYLKLYDVTPPPASGLPTTPKPYVIGSQVTFTWNPVTDSEGGIAGHHVVISTGPGGTGTIVFDGIVNGTGKTATAAFNQTLYCSVRAVNNAGIESNSASNSSAGTIAFDPAADRDGDGTRNDAEDLARTNPLDPNSVFRILSAIRPTATSVSLTWFSVSGVQYEVLATTGLLLPFTKISGPTPIPAAGSTTTMLDTAAGAPPFFTKSAAFPESARKWSSG